MPRWVPLSERIERHVVPITESGCWIWAGYLDDCGYGVTYFHKRKYRMHRLMWELTHGEIEAGLVVRHTCDIPCCCNPDHLRLGTQTDNVADMDTRGRRRLCTGESHGNAKITEKDAAEIRTSPLPITALAKQFGIGTSQVWRIKTMQTWKHIGGGSGF